MAYRPGHDNGRGERRLTGESRMLLRVEPCPNRKPQQPQHTNRKPPEHHWKQAEHAYGQADKQRRGDVAESQSPWLDERQAHIAARRITRRTTEPAMPETVN